MSWNNDPVLYLYPRRHVSVVIGGLDSFAIAVLNKAESSPTHTVTRAPSLGAQSTKKGTKRMEFVRSTFRSQA